MSRTRFEINPSQKMNLTDLRNALFSYLIAKQDGGEFILRINDANQSEYDINAEEFVYQILNTFHLDYDEGPKKEIEVGPYIQSERLDIYKTYAEKLVKKGKAYYCFCTKEELTRKRLEASEQKTTYLYDGTCRSFPKDEANRRISLGEKYVIREVMPKEGQTSYHDLVYGDITVSNNVLEDQILIKSDGTPTYNFASVLDDALMNITHVTGSTKFLSSMPKYLLLYEDLGFPVPEFIHFPEIIEKKNDSLEDLLEQGFLPQAILNYIALLGWSPKDNQEFFTIVELVREFSISKIHKRQSHFDIKKLEWMNHHYIMKMNDNDYIKFVRPYIENFYNLEGKSEEWINKLLLTFKNKLNFASEIALLAHMFFEIEIELDEECIKFLKSEESIESTLRLFKEEVEKLDDWNTESINEMLNLVEEQRSVSKKLLYMPIRVALTNRFSGPTLVDTLYLLGKDTILERLNEIL